MPYSGSRDEREQQQEPKRIDPQHAKRREDAKTDQQHRHLQRQHLAAADRDAHLLQDDQGE